MATIHESTNQGNRSNGNPSTFPSFGNIGAPYMAVLSLLGFTIGFLVWSFLTPMVPNVQTASQLGSPPPKKYQPPVDSKVESFPYLLVHSSSSSFGEILQVSNQVDKKKKKNKKGGNQVAISTNATNVKKICNQPHKVKFPCR